MLFLRFSENSHFSHWRFCSHKFVCVFDARAGDGDVYSSACFVSFEVTDHNTLKLTEIILFLLIASLIWKKIWVFFLTFNCKLRTLVVV